MSLSAIPGALAQSHILVSTAFGVGWERIAQWTVIGIVSAWFWTSSGEHVVAMVDPIHGLQPVTTPVAWLIELLGGLGVTQVRWLEATLVWTASLKDAWLEGALVVVAAGCATALARHRNGAGLITLSTLSLVFAVQISGNFAPVLWFGAVAASPALLALVLRSLQRATDASPQRPTRWLPARFIVLRLVGVVLSPILLPVFAPVIALTNLMPAYAHDDDGESAAHDLVSTGVSDLVAAEADGRQPSASTVLRILSGLALADSAASSRNRLAFGIQWGLAAPSGAAPNRTSP
ncbi:hypothetical protein F8O01_05385 [Pseudoclavibacter chungangensis]|uniref:Uncharacterized protein n=1 Tax=Pseudoclavibacter chungangensis TaxID=587635 RepID=A0A7J5BZA5_9MICO|nr:hypothetical protein [Pseudoclavibacter chungangensis]KAB1659690.1 hypothetical protein F8O01_05385 [Pseudoclavibacter chungangensis]NYJ67529.1 hypothetical protein [Pseudoclavibacter chungangensis]